MPSTTVFLPDGRFADYSLDARSALVAAHAQWVHGDWNTWDYDKKYGGLRELIREGKRPGSLRLGGLLAMEKNT